MPEGYVGDVVAYLKTVVGGARTGLLEKARKFIKGEEDVKEDAEGEKKEETEGEGEGEKEAQPEAMEVDGEGEAKGVQFKEAVEVQVDPAVEVRRARAEKLLAAMGEEA